MDYSASSALLGGIMFCIALSAWTLGHWQGSAALARPTLGEPQPPYRASLAARAPTATRAITPCQKQARTERQIVLGQTDSLSDLHAEVSAYRQQEQIFASLADDAFRFDRAQATERTDCRYLGITGFPTCGLSVAAMSVCDCEALALGVPETAPFSEAALQPSPGFVPVARV